MISISVLLREPVSTALVRDLDTQGQVVDVITELDAVVVKAPSWRLAAIRALPYVAAASPDTERHVDTLHSFADELKPLVKDEGEGIYIAVIGDGLPSDWRAHYPRERIATKHARAFDGGGGKTATVSADPAKWQYDPNEAHENIVPTILLGSREGAGDRRLRPRLRGAATQATVIPIRVSSGRDFEVRSWSSRVTRALVYVTKLKTSGALGTRR
jgi:hypothetical protein